MAVYTPKFTGAWVLQGKMEHDREQQLVKYNENTKAYLIRIVKNKRIVKLVTRKLDCDNKDAQGDSLAIEDLNKPAGGAPWKERLQSLEAVYDPETGIATCTKVLVEDEESWEKVNDLPVSYSEALIK
jgi:hypothetical protein